ncbi:MAG: hypothetical protein AAF716_09710 [Cyanobacteria bacterium P01_D01_bin.1]
MRSLKKAKSAIAVMSNIDRNQPDELTTPEQHEHPDRDLMCLVFADGSTATVQTQSNGN